MADPEIGAERGADGEILGACQGETGIHRAVVVYDTHLRVECRANGKGVLATDRCEKRMIARIVPIGNVVSTCIQCECWRYGVFKSSTVHVVIERAGNLVIGEGRRCGNVTKMI